MIPVLRVFLIVGVLFLGPPVMAAEPVLDCDQALAGAPIFEISP